MFTALHHFLSMWKRESAQTERVLAELTDASLAWRVAEEQRSLGDLAWHIVVSQREILQHTGLEWESPGKSVPRPPEASAILTAYQGAARALVKAIEQSWTDASLFAEDEVYGMRWTKGYTLSVLILHEVHHRGQLTALMRPAGLKVPGVYGPSGDEVGKG